jgi:hypothetical protein
MKVAIHQPNYIPWLGYFYKIYKSDVFVFLDDVQFTKNSFQNRNRIKTSQGFTWLTEPVLTKGRFGQLTNQVRFNNDIPWKKKHIKTLEQEYRSAKYFDEYFPKLQNVYFKEESKEYTLVEFNIKLIKFICEELGLNRRCEISSELKVVGKSTERLVNICRHLGGDAYLSGSGGNNYQDEAAFKDAEIELVYSDFCCPIYHQLWGEFVPNLSIFDYLFNCGNNIFKKESKE